MVAGEKWRHRKTGDLVRIEVQLSGLLSFSVLRDGHWLMCRDIWELDHFRREFEMQSSPEPGDA